MLPPFTIEHPLAQACISGDFHEEVLLNYLEEIDEETQQGNTPLHLAVIGNDITTIKFLLENSANPNYSNTYGETPLHWACKEGNTEIVRLLLRRRALVNLADTDGNTPLHWAAEYDQTEVITLLRGRGASTKPRNGSKSTPLDVALENSSTAATRRALAQSKDLPRLLIHRSKELCCCILPRKIKLFH